MPSMASGMADGVLCGPAYRIGCLVSSRSFDSSRKLLIFSSQHNRLQFLNLRASIGD
jgi:hypothetical protein